MTASGKGMQVAGAAWCDMSPRGHSGRPRGDMSELAEGSGWRKCKRELRRAVRPHLFTRCTIATTRTKHGHKGRTLDW